MRRQRGLAALWLEEAALQRTTLPEILFSELATQVRVGA
jgi:hypothetical protein